MNGQLYCLTLCLALALTGDAAADSVALEQMDLAHVRQGWGTPQVNRSIRQQPLSIAGQRFARGVGTHAHSSLWIQLGGAQRFTARVGVDDAAGGKATIEFHVIADGKKLWGSGVMKPGDAAQTVDVPLRGAKYLLLQVTDGGDGTDYDHANWAEAALAYAGEPPRAIPRPVLPEEPVLLTPPPGPAPRVNGPAVYGARPGNPFLYRIPAQGARPLEFSVDHLPASLRLDAATGIIRGTTPARGEYNLILRAKNAHGQSSRALRLVSGDTLSLTPQMGWNHWYTHYDRVTDRLVRQAADAMVQSGMADVGYQYVNIDDCWMNKQQSRDPQQVGPLRDAAGKIQPNRHFPDLKALTDYIHAQGLKAGIYTSPGPWTCAGFAGAYQHEAADARQFAEWGFDFLKYDWCSYGEVAKRDTGPESARLKKPYQLMGGLLKQQPRDIVFNLCQYGMGGVWTWGAEVGGHSWRTAGDLGFELDRVFEVALANAKHREFHKPGGWNDPDYIQIGFIGDAHGMGQPKPCPLTPTEQYSFVSLWALSAAPLFFSGDMGRLDAFTVNVLCNPEVIDIDQDPLGQCARVVPTGERTFLMVKPLADGSAAVGLCNAGEFPAEVAADWSALGLPPRPTVRDVWRGQDLGAAEREYRATVPRRGVLLLRVSAGK